MPSDDYEARAKREAATILAEVGPTPAPWLPRSYETLVSIVAVAWSAGYVAALNDQLGGDAA